MNNKVRSIAIATFLSALIAGCAKEPPKCSDEDTFTLIRQIIVDQLGGREGVTDKELQDNMKIEFPRASAFDEKIKKYNCEAKLIAGGSVELPITYESQLDDKNQHIVSVGGISRGDLMALQYAIAEGIKKSRAAKEETASSAPESTSQVQAKTPNYLPSIQPGTPYSDAREIMIKAGWEPIKMPEADACSEHDDRCKGRPEMEACAGSGMANCKFSWKKNDVLKRICTVGEEASFDSFCD
jgi:hypothetical protein